MSATLRYLIHFWGFISKFYSTLSGLQGRHISNFWFISNHKVKQFAYACPRAPRGELPFSVISSHAMTSIFFLPHPCLYFLLPVSFLVVYLCYALFLYLFCLWFSPHLVQKAEYDELLLATLGAIHNLSFYQLAIDDDDPQTKDVKHPDSMIEQMATISAALCVIYQWLPDSAQAKSEIARVLGNLTRSIDARVAVYTAGGFQFLLKNLASNDWDIVETSCGVLVNMLSDWERRAVFRELRGPLLLREVLQRSAMKHDWLLALICCQVGFDLHSIKFHGIFICFVWFGFVSYLVFCFLSVCASLSTLLISIFKYSLSLCTGDMELYNRFG